MADFSAMRLAIRFSGGSSQAPQVYFPDELLCLIAFRLLENWWPAVRAESFVRKCFDGPDGV